MREVGGEKGMGWTFDDDGGRRKSKNGVFAFVYVYPRVLIGSHD